jgi:hypothetical protein
MSARGQKRTTCSAPACLLPPAADIRRGAAGITLMISKVLGLHRNPGRGPAVALGVADVRGFGRYGGIVPPAGAIPREGGIILGEVLEQVVPASGAQGAKALRAEAPRDRAPI